MIRVTKFRRPSGYWYVRYWLSAKPVDESARTKSEASAEAHRVRREIELNAGIEPLRHADVADLIEPYLKSMPPKTTEKHKRFARRVLATLLELCGRKHRSGKHRLATQQVTPETIDRFIHHRATTTTHDGTQKDSRGRKVVRSKCPSNVTLKTDLRYLSGFFNWCCKQRPRYLRENPIPLSSAAKLKGDAKPHFMITEEELRRLLAACKTPREYLFLMLGWWTGGRRSEILALHYYHFDFMAETLDMRHFKNNMFSVLPVSQQIIDIVKRLYADTKESATLFPHDPFQHHGFERLCRMAGVRHHRFHDFRISTSMIIKSNGFDASLAGLWVGNTAACNRSNYSDLGTAAPRIASLLELSDPVPVPWQTA